MSAASPMVLLLLAVALLVAVLAGLRATGLLTVGLPELPRQRERQEKAPSDGDEIAARGRDDTSTPARQTADDPAM
ncbi:hypothetical protein JSY14_10515 [Brachybacterium sp. EF45031]|uniref:hypothetical protein n=1 Tax=Brachybacterium sillae TaxID=2810536 RepID=UPI00217ECDF7|nr:hypothetical protein [Brachybacterium sillae]MCS6712439.1 hypothetical protein [Brachybacterium sillae]